MSANDFDSVQKAFTSGGVDEALKCLADRLRDQKKYHELFEALKMQVRRRLGLPLLYGDGADDLSTEKRDELEEGLIEGCREVGLLLLKDGKIREGWMYLRPVGDRKAAAAEIAKIKMEEENMEELIDVCLRDSVDVERGFKLVLDNYGTCNAITTYESEMSRHSRKDQDLAAGLLLKHLYRELVENLKVDIGRQEAAAPKETTLKGLIEERPWLFQEMTYHTDTTHLSSVVRFARSLNDPELLRMAIDLTEYGRRLHKQFQYEGEPPFNDMYLSHAFYFQALLGENTDAAIEYFRDRAEKCDPQTEGTAPIEVYVDLLARLKRFDEAIDTAIRLTPDGTQSQGIAPTLVDLSQRAGKFDQMVEYCRQKGDLLGFTAGLVKATK